MSNYLVITVRFLVDRYHGRTENGREPEWPPSPLRLFQSVVAGAAARWHDPGLQEREVAALRWFEELEPPHIIAPVARPGKPLLRYVRENLSDVDPEKRDAKFSRPMLFVGEPTVVYYWSIDPKHQDVANVIASCSRHCRALGWGIDMVIGNGEVTEIEPDSTTGERWLPTVNAHESVPLRVPRHTVPPRQYDTLKELRDRFSHSLGRIAPDGRNPVPPLSAFRVVGYRRASDPPTRPCAAFSLLKPDASGYRAFDTVRRGVAVAGMMRCAARKAALDSRPNEELWVNQFILGHAEARGEPYKPVAGPRLAYVPLPSIESRGEGRANVVAAIRRVLLTVLPGDGQENIVPSDTNGRIRPQKRSDRDDIDWAGRAMSGMDLIPDRAAECLDDSDHPELQPCGVEWEPPQPQEKRQAVATLSRLPANDKMVQRYVRPASTWATVTPVILPGYDDPSHYRRRLKSGVGTDEQRRLLSRLSQRIDGLIRKAIGQAGFSELLAQNAVIDWRKMGFWPGTDLAYRYVVPRKLKRFSRYHVRIHWRDASGSPVEVRGPICLGAGRFYGLGLFAAET